MPIYSDNLQMKASFQKAGGNYWAIYRWDDSGRQWTPTGMRLRGRAQVIEYLRRTSLGPFADALPHCR
jgi:hypothetical protein